MYSVLIFIQVQHKFIKLHLRSTIILIPNVTFIFYSSFYPFNNFLFIQHLLRISHYAWSNALPAADKPGAAQKRWNFEKNTEYVSGSSHSFFSGNYFQEKQGIDMRENILQWNLSF